MRPVIKFSHWYPKLMRDQTALCCAARLLMVAQDDFAELSWAFKLYDTGDGLYPLPEKGPCLVLLFLKEPHSVKAADCFTTVRRLTAKKLRYYNGLIGDWFTIQITK